ncbi:MAG: hypothetical protein KF758_11015 [Anaerolineales bacterium]|nr:hypothetical protein [Anaerolineales bacterium]
MTIQNISIHQRNILQQLMSPRLQIHGLLFLQSVMLIVFSVNRLSSLTAFPVNNNPFIRWTEIINLLVIPPVEILIFYFLMRVLGGKDGIANLSLNIVFLLGVYLLGASYGNHETTNYLNNSFCFPNEVGSELCKAIEYHDNLFSHWLFFTGFVFLNGSLICLQWLSNVAIALSKRDLLLLAINGVILATGIFFNLIFQTAGPDIIVIVLLALLSYYIWLKSGTKPLTIYYLVAFGVGAFSYFGFQVYKLIN